MLGVILLFINRPCKTVICFDIFHAFLGSLFSKTISPNHILFLAHMSRSDKVSFCDHILSIVRLCVRKQFLQMISPHNLQDSGLSVTSQHF